jgi:hypothetical protein
MNIFVDTFSTSIALTIEMSLIKSFAAVFLVTTARSKSRLVPLILSSTIWGCTLRKAAPCFTSQTTSHWHRTQTSFVRHLQRTTSFVRSTARGRSPGRFYHCSEPIRHGQLSETGTSSDTKTILFDKESSFVDHHSSTAAVTTSPTIGSKNYIFGYGSLMCPLSRQITNANLMNKFTIPITIHNLERIWCARTTTGYTAMGVQFTTGTCSTERFCTGILIGTIDADELHDLDQREASYNRLPV